MPTTKETLTGRIATQTDNTLSETMGDQHEKVLSFQLADEEYAVDILRVQEIRGWGSVTRIPRMPDYIKGVLNLRGAVVPVIDLRLRFGLPAIEYGPTTVIIIVTVITEQKKRDMGIVVDAVSDVYTIGEDEMKPPPEFGGALQGSFLKGLITKEDYMIIVLDIDRVLDSDQLTLLQEISKDDPDEEDKQIISDMGEYTDANDTNTDAQ